MGEILDNFRALDPSKFAFFSGLVTLRCYHYLRSFREVFGKDEQDFKNPF